ncbi:MAG: excinuclease ABC subunit B [Candidatus Zambryskibacteria bacterium RIFCSPHIGHO2_12_FULL_44_12b]|uniref:UvrABC system protein B n=1 Tax=Candidatus Zambryskibacteria bacterium RIFCSPLOWO2_01_FULL_45_21 TaxID=1802761 RepID=A0A1G2U0K6_9BACT|nr:MAG: excinuclease ABC subunit B [Candidatus Zambryskibacteria bacterium RIFCSPHIGHO2_12_FULL_44_12b]OHB03061.1 MAG: excinuclease ABC subunit B [Candidatus Zambryskibacteria bacterium RIFCSPLOWO2_01_FULL_45_21]
MSQNKFQLKSDFAPAGDQPRAIKELTDGIEKGLRHQTLLGVTGSGKTFTVANVIEKIQKPTLVIAHNKTLAAQLAQEYKEFFPNNAVHYFVSYYDYYQPEAYIPVTDTYIEKDAQINEEIDRLRHASTQALLTRKDVIIVASVSCIYGLGSPIEYEKVNLKIAEGDRCTRAELIRKLVAIHFERTNADLLPGQFRVIGNTLEVMPVSEKIIYRLELSVGRISKILKIDAVSRTILLDLDNFFLFPAKHYITDTEKLGGALKDISEELAVRLKEFNDEGKLLEAERLKRRTGYDLAMIREVGYCSGIENYSRHLDGRTKGEPPDTLLSYFPHLADGASNFLTIIDESHVTIPQIGGMYAGDRSRKETLVEHGFRLPSAKDNRPLTFEEFNKRVGQIIYTSATPAKYEKEKSERTVEQLIRPTGLIDPEVVVRPIIEKSKYGGQIADFINEAERAISSGGRAIATTLTKKMAEDLSEFLKERGIKAQYLHSDIKTIERIEILTSFRRGSAAGGFDCLVGVNLLREGLDLPEVSFIGILDADKEGFLRSETSLIQIIGRAARNIDGKVALYADSFTGSIERAVKETNRRRKLQLEYNKEHNITPKTITKKIKDITEGLQREHGKAVSTLLSVDEALFRKNPKKLIRQKEIQMNQAVKILDFESAAILRDEILELTRRLENK